jgi:D-tyrosyl-tRNA(Tyr) deacylase
MKALIQRVKNASVTVNGKTIASIEQGLLVLLGVGHEDDKAKADKLLKKLLSYRIFADSDDKMNLSVSDIGGELLIVSQFTLMADTQKGTRPGFSSAAKPALAEQLYDYFVEQAKKQHPAEKIATGQFAADMKVALVNDGPVTFMLEV